MAAGAAPGGCRGGCPGSQGGCRGSQGGSRVAAAAAAVAAGGGRRPPPRQPPWLPGRPGVAATGRGGRRPVHVSTRPFARHPPLRRLDWRPAALPRGRPRHAPRCSSRRRPCPARSPSALVGEHALRGGALSSIDGAEAAACATGGRRATLWRASVWPAAADNGGTPAVAAVPPLLPAVRVGPRPGRAAGGGSLQSRARWCCCCRARRRAASSRGCAAAAAAAAAAAVTDRAADKGQARQGARRLRPGQAELTTLALGSKLNVQGAALKDLLDKLLDGENLSKGLMMSTKIK